MICGGVRFCRKRREDSRRGVWSDMRVGRGLGGGAGGDILGVGVLYEGEGEERTAAIN